MRRQRFAYARPSKPSEFHTELLAEPDLILSHLPARPPQEARLPSIEF